MPENSLTGSTHSQNMSDREFFALCQFIHDRTGITIAENRRSMLVSRLQRRLRVTGIPTFQDYISLIKKDIGEQQEMVNRVTTNETYFYRTPRIWSYLRESTIPEFLREESNKTMRVWSAAASTGEEGYTVGAVLEDVRQQNPGFDYSVLGTDISTRVLEIASHGSYFGRSVVRFKKEDPSLFKSYLHGSEVDGFSVKSEIKCRVKFQLYNLLEPLNCYQKFDIVFLRNVLIYFTGEDQEKILANVRVRMKEKGTLIIGESETLLNLRCDFEAIAPLIYRPRLRSSFGSCVK